MKKIKLAKHNVFTFTYLFINCHCIIIAGFIYYYLEKYQGKQKHLLPFCDTKLKQFLVSGIN